MVSYTLFMLSKDLFIPFSPFFPLPAPEPPASVWSLPDQLRLAQFVAPLSHNFLGAMRISSVSFRWSRKEGMKHNFWSPKSMIIRFLAQKRIIIRFQKSAVYCSAEFQCVL